MPKTSTNIYCPFCKIIHPCGTGGPDRQAVEEEDIHILRRKRTCLITDQTFKTIEISENHFHELLAYRSRMNQIAALANSKVPSIKERFINRRKMIKDI